MRSLQKEENYIGELEIEAAHLAGAAGNLYATDFARGKRDKPASTSARSELACQQVGQAFGASYGVQ